MRSESDGKQADEILPPNLAIRAMRDSGYRSTTYALAELIDNSAQAKASRIAVICIEESQLVDERERYRVSSIGVLDNGVGMSIPELRAALQFGNGAHLRDRNGMGRFGMGLPNSSISQCHRVEVWTWQSGPDNAIFSYLDVNEMEEGKLRNVPPPQPVPVPQEWRNRGEVFGKSGTLVVWKNLDASRLTWKGAKATLDNTELLVGRLYRKFIDEGKITICLRAYQGRQLVVDRTVRVNDPLYLMRNSSTPHPFDKEPMFREWGADEDFEINYRNKKHKVVFRMSWASEATLTKDKTNRGDKPYGKHAGRNLGISVVRAGREIDLDAGWTTSYDPVERWWGAEICFPPDLDDIFGVTNNKQGTTIFSQMPFFDLQAEKEPGESTSEFIKRTSEQGDPRGLLIEIQSHIRHQLSEVRQKLKSQNLNQRSKKSERHDAPSVDDLATTKFNERAETHEIASDKEKFTETDKEALEKELVEENNYTQDVAREIANAVVKRNLKVTFCTKGSDSPAFFHIEHKQGGLTVVAFNTQHPFHSQLMEALEPPEEEDTGKNLLARLQKAAETIKLLFAAWARYESEEINQKEKFSELRQDWGKMARQFLRDVE